MTKISDEELRHWELMATQAVQEDAAICLRLIAEVRRLQAEVERLAGELSEAEQELEWFNQKMQGGKI